jgi:hypothetical protein
MNLKRTATIGAVGVALAAWLAAAATSGVRDMAAPRAVKITPIEVRGAELANEIARLHDRLRPTSSPRQPSRNLFQFTSARPHPPVPVLTKPALTEAVIAPAPLPPSPLKLSGIAEDPGANGPIRTAIISGQGQLFLVKEGEMVTTRYRVAKISADGVELVDVGTNLPLRLVMK